MKYYTTFVLQYINRWVITPFEAHFYCKPNIVWHSITHAASTDNLTWKNALFSLDRNKKMFPAKVMQNYGEPNDATMGTYDRIEHPLVSGMSVSKSAQEATIAPVLQVQAKG